MPNPCTANWNTACDECGEPILEGDQYWYVGDKLCTSCAFSGGNICDCGQQKKPEYDTCYECSQEETNGADDFLKQI